MLYACNQKFDVTGNLEKFYDLATTTAGLGPFRLRAHGFPWWWGAGAAAGGRPDAARPRRAVTPIHPSSSPPFLCPCRRTASNHHQPARFDPAGGGRAGGLRCRPWRAPCSCPCPRPGTAEAEGGKSTRGASSSVFNSCVADSYSIATYSCCSIQWRTESARSFPWPMIISLYMITILLMFFRV